MNLVDSIIAYESGELEDHLIIEMFSELLRSGTLEHLQGHYGSAARCLIDGGILDEHGNILVEVYGE